MILFSIFKCMGKDIPKDAQCSEYKIYHISKTKNLTKKIILQKNDRNVISNIPYKFDHFEESWIFRCPKPRLLDARGTQTRYDVI